MGNRSSSHYPPPPPWMHHHPPPPQLRGGSYSTSASPYPDMKRPLGPGAYAEPYQSSSAKNHQHRRSMMSLNADSGYMASSPEDSGRMRRGSRMSLNQLDFDHMMMPPPPPHPRLIIPPDAKTLKKLEKMEKKHQKLLKKLGARGIPIQMQPPPPFHHHPQHPVFNRTMSFDDLHRIHENEVSSVPMRNNQNGWRQSGEQMNQIRRENTQSQYIKQHHNYSSSNTTRRTEMGGSLASSSPMTSSEEGHSSDPWNSSSISSGRNNNMNRREIISPPMYSSTPHQQQQQPSPKAQSFSKTIEVKIEKAPPMTQESKSQNATYAQPIIARNQASYDSRASSIATSQIRCDQSEIDFSWVNEEEDKLKRENHRRKSSNTSSSRLPEYYFGMDPPSVDEKENDQKRRSGVFEKTQQFEIEARRIDRKEPTFLSRSTHHLSSTNDEVVPHPDYSPLQPHTKETGPAERRIYRIQRQSENNNNIRNDDRRYRSSIAF